MEGQATEREAWAGRTLEGAMGLWDVVRREVGRVLQDSSRSRPRSRGSSGKAKPRRTTPEALRGPDPGTLLTAEEMEAATGGRPVGEGDRKSGGQDVDVGYMRVCEWQLSNGDELLINFTRFGDEDDVALWRSRFDDPSWKNVDDEKPLEGVGEVGIWYVTKADGGNELHLSAKQGMYYSNLVHSSRAGATDITPLANLMTKVLSRLSAF
jgi:hypothetical protein